MITHDLIQGSPEWCAYRTNHRNASDAPAMLGCSPYKSRNDLLHECHTGIAPEVDSGTQARFDDGHRFEALARPLGEKIIGQDLYPVVGSEGLYSASFDGLTMAEDIAFEHKTLNGELRAVMVEGCTGADLPKLYRVQMEQQCMVSGASRVLFMASKWTGDELDEERHCWYEPDESLRAEIIAGWDQFAADLATYEPKEFAPKLQAEAIMQLPALAIQIRGEVAHSNLPVFKAKAEAFIASIKTDLLTDEDFVNAEAMVRFCERTEGDLDLAKRAALEQTADIAELMRTIDHISAQMRDKRLSLTRTIKDKKEQIKTKILTDVQRKFAEHVAALEAEISPLRLVFQSRDFAGAMKNKRTLATLHDAVDTELANAKIMVNEFATAVRGRLTWYRENVAGHEFLFADLQAIIQKPDDDFQMLVRSRIESHKRLEVEKAAQIAAEQKAVALTAAPEPVAQVTPIASARPAQSAPTLRLGQINERIAPLSITADGLRTLGFEPAGRDKAAVLYHDADFPSMCAAMMRHISAVQSKLAA